VDLYEYALLSSFDVTKRKHDEVRVYLRDTVTFPFLDRDAQGEILCFAKPKRLPKGGFSFLVWTFDSANSVHQALLWRLFKASIHHLSAHVTTSSFEAYANWAKNKDLNLATFAVNQVEDAAVEAYLRCYYPSHLVDYASANALSYISMKPLNTIRNDALRIMTAILSVFSTGLSKGMPDNETQERVGKAVSVLKEIENSVYKELQEKTKAPKDESPLNPKNLLFDQRMKAAEQIYSFLDGHGEISDIPSLPYTESHGRNTVFNRSAVPSEEEIESVLNKALEMLDPSRSEPIDLVSELRGDSIQSEVAQVFSSWEAQEGQRQKILEQYRVIGKGTHFKSFGFPNEDYTEYIRRRNMLSSTVRRILEKLRLFRNVEGEDYKHEFGSLDLQEAVQVIASRSPRTDVFVREELQTRDEMWAILIDASYSLSFFTGEVLDIALCMAEVARKLMVNQTSWSMFAFNNGFYIVKDFPEPYSNHIRARIGGLKHHGMTYLPDGLLLAAESLRRRIGDMKVLVVVSDFFPSGYEEVDKALAESVKKIEKTGIGVIGIGINSSAVKKYFRTNCVVENPYDLMKKFVKAFFEFSSSV
jgi:hypothetical protein